MLLLLRAIVGLWAIGSVALGVMVFLAMTGGYGASAGAAAYEGLETIPEFLMVAAGFKGSPVLVDVGYWLALGASVVIAFGRRSR